MKLNEEIVQSYSSELRKKLNLKLKIGMKNSICIS